MKPSCVYGRGQRPILGGLGEVGASLNTFPPISQGPRLCDRDFLSSACWITFATSEVLSLAWQVTLNDGNKQICIQQLTLPLNCRLLGRRKKKSLQYDIFPLGGAQGPCSRFRTGPQPLLETSQDPVQENQWRCCRLYPRSLWSTSVWWQNKGRGPKTTSIMMDGSETKIRNADVCLLAERWPPSAEDF